MWKRLTGIALIGILMTGCIADFSMKSATSINDIAATTSIALAQEECYRSDKIDRGDMSSMEYGILVANQNLRDVALAAMGKEKCKIVTVYDSQIAEVEAKTGMVNGVVGAVASVATNGIIGASVVGLVGNSGNEYSTTGFGADIVVADKSNNDPSLDSYNPTTVTTSTTTPVAP